MPLLTVTYQDLDNTPWAVKGEVNFDRELQKKLSPYNGWEMAFSCRCDSTLPSCRYFGLYNRYFGLMRIFCYVCKTDILGKNTGEAFFETLHGGNDKEKLYPFYNSLAYSIPSNHNTHGTLDKQNLLDLKKDLINVNISQSFHDYKAPSVNGGHEIKAGWTCFDLNLSGYMPDGLQWDPKDKSAHRLDVHC